MQVTIKGQCPNCRRPIALHEHQPAEMPTAGDAVTLDGVLYVVTRTRDTAPLDFSAAKCITCELTPVKGGKPS